MKFWSIYAAHIFNVARMVEFLRQEVGSRPLSRGDKNEFIFYKTNNF